MALVPFERVGWTTVPTDGQTLRPGIAIVEYNKELLESLFRNFSWFGKIWSSVDHWEKNLVMIRCPAADAATFMGISEITQIATDRLEIRLIQFREHESIGLTKQNLLFFTMPKRHEVSFKCTIDAYYDPEPESDEDDYFTLQELLLGSTLADEQRLAFGRLNQHSLIHLPVAEKIKWALELLTLKSGCFRFLGNPESFHLMTVRILSANSIDVHDPEISSFITEFEAYARLDLIARYKIVTMREELLGTFLKMTKPKKPYRGKENIQERINRK
jgi:hypothetical protein